MSTRRTTIGVSIPVPAPDGDYLQQRRVEFGDSEAWRIPAHITLVPPTEVDAATYAAFVAHCETVAGDWPPFDVLLRGTGTFRPISDVVYIHVAQGVSACERLEKQLRSGPVQRPLDFYYHPHVTVAHNVSAADLERAFTELAGFRADFVVDAFHLYEQGPDEVWRPVKDFPLQGG
ncbi:2'-5' RNA ligase family protein [Intrasporangium sp.]|uniref:2'-5' RNA ligase family protein n=1 Tax=Intrasporangium sp. TaxID=1925024 RepID=UPI003221A548